MLFVCDDAAAAHGCLSAAGFQCDAESVALVKERASVTNPSLMRTFLRNEGIGVFYWYASLARRNQPCIVFRADDTARAVAMMKRRMRAMEAERAIHPQIACRQAA